MAGLKEIARDSSVVMVYVMILDTPYKPLETPENNTYVSVNGYLISF